MLPRAKYVVLSLSVQSMASSLCIAFSRCFGFVSKKINGNRSSTSENECHVFAEIDPSQPASAIVNFVSKVMIGSVPV